MTKLLSVEPFIIAEIGSNWTDFTQAKDAISAAAACGADAVKFQLFSQQELYAQGSSDREMQLEWLPKLKEKADACGIEFMCSAFSPEGYETVNPFVEVHKIASSETSYPQLLQKVKSFNKPIIMSVGASSRGDVMQSLGYVKGGTAPLVLLYCSSAYPSEEYNLFQMKDLHEFTKCPVGFSDHSTSVIYPALSAVKHFGAMVIEKHVNFAGVMGPDSAHSLNGTQFAKMCKILKGKEAYWEFQPQPEERDMFLKHNRRLIATRDISQGETFRFGGNYGAFRSLKDDAKGLNGFDWQLLEKSLGAKRPIKAGDGIGPGDF